VTVHPADGSYSGLRVAYVMSRFPKLTETFILREMVAMEQLGVRIELYPLLHERGALIQPAARPFVERAHYFPFLSLPILRSQLYWLGDRRRRKRYLRALFDVIGGTWRSPARSALTSCFAAVSAMRWKNIPFNVSVGDARRTRASRSKSVVRIVFAVTVDVVT
jgi:hypothetical protein